MQVYVERTKEGLLNKASANYLPKEECYEVEIIKNDNTHDTNYRIELIDNDYIDVTKKELNVLKQILNDKTVSLLLGLED